MVRMGLNIKNERTHKLVQELAEATGESLTTAVTIAVKERLERLHHKSRKTDVAERLKAIAKDAAPRFKEPWRSMDHGEFLYGDDGLPR